MSDTTTEAEVTDSANDAEQSEETYQVDEQGYDQQKAGVVPLEQVSQRWVLMHGWPLGAAGRQHRKHRCHDAQRPGQ